MNTTQYNVALIVQESDSLFRYYNLYGDYNKEVRRRIIWTIYGGKKPPLSKCGLTAVEKAIESLFPVESYSCLAHLQEQVQEQMKNLVAPDPEPQPELGGGVLTLD